jgi:hypothetical protein
MYRREDVRILLKLMFTYMYIKHTVDSYISRYNFLNGYCGRGNKPSGKVNEDYLGQVSFTSFGITLLMSISTYCCIVEFLFYNSYRSWDYSEKFDLWNPIVRQVPNILSNRNSGALIPRVKRKRHEADQLQLVSRSRKRVSIHPLPPIRLHGLIS